MNNFGKILNIIAILAFWSFFPTLIIWIWVNPLKQISYRLMLTEIIVLVLSLLIFVLYERELDV